MSNFSDALVELEHVSGWVAEMEFARSPRRVPRPGPGPIAGTNGSRREHFCEQRVDVGDQEPISGPVDAAFPLIRVRPLQMQLDPTSLDGGVSRCVGIVSENGLKAELRKEPNRVGHVE